MTSFKSLSNNKSNLSRTDSETSASSRSIGAPGASSSTTSTSGSGRKQLRSLTRNLFNDLVHFELQSLRKRRSTFLSSSSAPPRRTLLEMTATASQSFPLAAKVPSHAPERLRLLELQHAERPTALTPQYMKYIGARYGSESELMGERTNLFTPKVELLRESKQAQKERSK